MSLTNLKKLLASVMLVLALTTQVFASQGFRPWAPYQHDRFGGGTRRAEGIYGTIEGVYYTFAPVKNIVIGDTSPATNGYRETYTGDAVLNQTNTINTNNLGVVSGMGTRAEIGNFRGHHGWSIAGYSVLDMTCSMEHPNGSVVINDRNDTTVFSIIGANVFYNKILNGVSWDQFYETPFDGERLTGVSNYYARSLWGWFVAPWVNNGTDNSNTIWVGTLAPLPINFENAKVTSKMDHWVVEALYTYRCHPSRFGNLDLFGGVRYMEIDDSLNFYGEGLPWKGVEEDVDTGELTGTVFAIGSVLGDSDWRFKAQNHIVAPQIGARISRTNDRWTLSAEGKFMAGLNQQNLRSQGSFGSYYEKINTDIFPTELLSETGRAYGIYPWTPIGALYGTRSFDHSAIRHAFSPGVEVKINANWQLTNAVGINFGVTGMWVDEIARGAYINDYSIDRTGKFFGLNDDGYTNSALMYGINFGLTVNRY